MKLNGLRAQTNHGQWELIVELDDGHYEMMSFLSGLPARSVATRLRQLATRIEAHLEHKVSCPLPDNKV